MTVQISAHLVAKCGLINPVGLTYYNLFIATAAMLDDWHDHQIQL